MSLYEELNTQIQQLRAENELDWLTGAYNRGACQKHIDEQILNGGGVLILVDVNDFSKVNAKYGHLAGDRALQQLTDVLRHMVLKSDIIGRVGGDEFVIFIRGERTDSFVEERIRQIRARVAEEPFSNIGSKPMRLTCGWARSTEGDDYTSLFVRAEEDLKEKKTAEIPSDEERFRTSIRVDGKKIRSALREPGTIRGAYYQEYEQFEVLYRYTERLMKRGGKSAFILLLTLAEQDGSMLNYEGRAENMRILGECIGSSLRITDVYTRYSSAQYLIMNTDTDTRYTETIAGRVRAAFYKRVGSDSSNLLLYESYPMGSVEETK